MAPSPQCVFQNVTPRQGLKCRLLAQEITRRKLGTVTQGKHPEKSGFLEQPPQREWGRRVSLWPPANPQNLYLGVITGQREIKIADGIKTGNQLALRILEYPK